MAERFRALTDIELDGLDDAALLSHLVRAREVEALEQATLALHVFVFRLEPLIAARVSGKVPPSEVELVVGAVFDSILEQSFSSERAPWDGRSEASLRAWVRTITQRRIADSLRSPRPRLDSLPEEHHGDSDSWSEDVAVELDPAGEIEVIDAVERCLSELSETHAEVVWLAVFEDLPTKEVAERVGANPAGPDSASMSPANVDKIKSRFRARLRELLVEGDD